MEMTIAKGIIWLGWQKAKIVMLAYEVRKHSIKNGLARYKSILPEARAIYMNTIMQGIQELLAKKQEQP